MPDTSGYRLEFPGPVCGLPWQDDWQIEASRLKSPRELRSRNPSLLVC